jgi:tetratricopeptide (TPR) repeat protein
MLGANERPGAEAILGEALELARRARTLATGRASVTYARTLAQVLDTWSALVLRVDRTAGTASLREAVAIMRDVIAVQEDAQTIVELRDSLCALADAVIDDAAGAAAFKEANALYEEAIRLARRLCEGLEFAATGLSELAGTYARAGRGRERAGDTHTALAAFEDALLFARQAYDVDSSDTDALHALRDAIDAVARTRRATGDAAGALTTEQALLFLPRR